VPRKRVLPVTANGSNLPLMVGAVIYVRVSTNLRSRLLERASAGKRKSRPRISACRHNSARTKSTAGARVTRSSNAVTRKARSSKTTVAQTEPAPA